jgi:hypothetical protein
MPPLPLHSSMFLCLCLYRIPCCSYRALSNSQFPRPFQKMRPTLAANNDTGEVMTF